MSYGMLDFLVKLQGQPPNTTLPINNFTLYGTQDQSLTRITFFLSVGEYHFSVSPSDNFFTPTNGTVSVNGNTTVPVHYSGTSCTLASHQSTPSVTTATSTNSNQTCTPAATTTQNNATQVLILCHTESYRYSSTNSSSASSLGNSTSG